MLVPVSLNVDLYTEDINRSREDFSDLLHRLADEIGSEDGVLEDGEFSDGVSEGYWESQLMFGVPISKPV